MAGGGGAELVELRVLDGPNLYFTRPAVKVTLADHSTWPARVLASDPNMDLAVLAIAAPKSRLKPITVGDSHSLKVGQWAFANEDALFQPQRQS